MKLIANRLPGNIGWHFEIMFEKICPNFLRILVQNQRYLKKQKSENYFFIGFNTLRIFLDQKPNLVTFDGRGWLRGYLHVVNRGMAYFLNFLSCKRKYLYMQFSKKNHRLKPITYLEKLTFFFSSGNLFFLSYTFFEEKKWSLLRGRGCISLTRTGLKYITCESFVSQKQRFTIFPLFSDRYFIDC